MKHRCNKCDGWSGGFFFEGGIPTLGSGVFECRTLLMATYACATYAVCRRKKKLKNGEEEER